MKNRKTEYTLGFIFSLDLNRVLLMEKFYNPIGLDSMKGKLNGIGGKIEKDESAIDCIVRETREESGLIIDESKWINFCNLDAKFGYIHCFYCFTNNIYQYKQMEKEKLGIYNLFEGWNNSYLKFPRMNNIDWMITMALNNYKNLDSTKCFEVKELY